MRLGVVLTGAGACAAASAGALTWLLDAGVSPCAVCGMQAAAWPAALYLAGYDAGRLRGAAAQAARMGRRLLRADASASAVLGMKKSALCRGRRLEKLLAGYDGTLLAVSHDRTFIEHVGDVVYQLADGCLLPEDAP